MRKHEKHPSRLRSRISRFLAVLVATCVAATALAASAPGAEGQIPSSAEASSLGSKSPRVGADSAFALPSGGQCLSRLTIRVRAVPHVRWTKATVTLGGNRVATLRSSGIYRPVTIESLPAGRFVLVVSARSSRGRVVSASRRYQSCGSGPKPSPKPSPKPAPAPGAPRPELPQPPVAASPVPGSYSGRTRQAENIYFYVSADGTRLLDVSVPRVYVSCVPGKEFVNHLEIGEIEIDPDGSFAATATQEGTLEGGVAHYTYAVSGHIQGTDATGIVREDVAYANGTTYSCSSNDQGWEAVRDDQGSQSGAPSTGSYSGRTRQAENIYFYVSADGSHLLDVSVPRVYVGCVPGKEFVSHLEIGDVAIAPDGSFAGTATQEGTFEGGVANYTYSLSGHFHGFDSSGRARFAGIVREDVAYANGTTYSCSSNDQSWEAVRETQGSQSSPPATGSYSGRTRQAENILFSVSADGDHLLDVSVPRVYVGCVLDKEFVDHLEIGDVAIEPDGSFATTATRTGVLEGKTANYTYSLSGHFHGFDSSGRARFAGVLREDIAFGIYSCSSNNQSWTAIHS